MVLQQKAIQPGHQAPVDEAGSNHVITVIQTLEVMMSNASEHKLPFVQEVLEASKDTLVQWIASGEYYMPVRDTLLRMLRTDLEFS